MAELQTAQKASEVRWAASQAQVHALESQARSQQRAIEAAGEEREALQARGAELEEGWRETERELAAFRASAAASRAEMQRQLDEASAQYDRLVSKKAEVGGALEAVGKELAAVKSALRGPETPPPPSRPPGSPSVLSFPSFAR